MLSVARHRHAVLSHWLERGEVLSADEASFHLGLHPSVQSILAPKRLLLWKEMMEFYEYPDCAVFDEVVAGVGLAGLAPVVKAFDPCFKPAKMTVADLAAQAHQSRQVMLASIRSSGDAEIDRTVFDKTQEELECGGSLALTSWLTCRPML